MTYVDILKSNQGEHAATTSYVYLAQTPAKNRPVEDVAEDSTSRGRLVAGQRAAGQTVVSAPLTLNLHEPDFDKLRHLPSDDVKNFWTNAEKHPLKVYGATNLAGQFNMIRACEPCTLRMSSYLAVLIGAQGGNANDDIFDQVSEHSPISLILPITPYHDIMISSDIPSPPVDDQTGHYQNQQQTTPCKSDKAADCPPANASAHRCAKAVAACIGQFVQEDNGPRRVRLLENGARLITAYLLHRNGFHHHMSKPKEDDAHLDSILRDINPILQKKFDESHDQSNLFSVTRHPRPHLGKHGALGNTCNDIIDLFAEILNNCPCEESAAAGAAILTLGIVRFAKRELAEYKSRQSAIAKGLDILGALLGIAPHAGAALTAGAVIGKTISDTVFDHRMDQVSVVETIGKRILAAALLEKGEWKKKAKQQGQPATETETSTNKALESRLACFGTLCAVLPLAD